jgi:beta-aspartyl-peptidase (threonine type)
LPNLNKIYLTITLGLSLTLNIFFAKDHKPFAIAIHGGAETISTSSFSPEQEKAICNKLKHAVDAGYKVLKKGGDSLDAFQTAINVLDNSPLFNAGVGAVDIFDGGRELMPR